MTSPFSEFLGPWPVSVALDAQSLGSEDCGSYVREKVSYSVAPDTRVCAYVNVPKLHSSPLPAIFCHHQHAGQFHLGKSEVVGFSGNPDLAYAHHLAARGYVTISPDAIGFEERNWSPDGHSNVGWFELSTRLVRGQTLLSACLNEVSIGLNYLETRPDVDSSRLGFIGHSYGGRMAIWAPAFDSRIKASVSNCGCIPYRASYSHDTGIQAEFVIPGFADQHDLEDLFPHYSDTALLISAGLKDKWSRDAETVFAGAQRELGEKAELAVYDVGHEFLPEMRMRAYEFLDRQLFHPPQ